MKRVRFFPNVITAFGLACGLFVILKISTLDFGRGNYELVLISTLLLLAAALADFVDGALARAIHGESEFGFVFDSMSDAISFGVAPSVILLKTFSFEQSSFLSFLCASGAMIYSLCGVLRLVRYSVKGKGELSLEEMEAKKRYFTGLPITAAAMAAIGVNLLSLSPLFQEWFPMGAEKRALILTGFMTFLGYLMVCRLKFPSLKMLRFKIPSFHHTFLVVIAAVLFIYGLIYFFALILALVLWGYIAVSLSLSLIRLLAGKKSKTLEEFEPDDSDDA